MYVTILKADYGNEFFFSLIYLYHESQLVGINNVCKSYQRRKERYVHRDIYGLDLFTDALPHGLTNKCSHQPVRGKLMSHS